MPENTLFSYFSRANTNEILSGSLPWGGSLPVSIERYWNGLRPSIPSSWSNQTRVQSIWTKSALCFCFDCRFDSLNVRPELGDGGPIDRLWEYDVVEAFLRPGGCEDYFEIEISPLGQWLSVHVLRPRIDVDFEWDSHLRVKTWVDQDLSQWISRVALPFESIQGACSLKRPPRVGDIWRINLFRVTGMGPDREFLAWRPTRTATPDFHVPEAFGSLIFMEEE